MHPLLSQTDHRTAPMPPGPWIMLQKWHDLLFAHWAVPAQSIRHLVPQQLDLDLHDGKAWVGVIPFWMSSIRGRGAPPVPGLSSSPEINVRSYVTYRGIPGVYFWSLDIASHAAVWGARTFYHLPYFYASMSVKNAGEKFTYSCSRLDDPKPAEFRGRYWPTSVPRQRQKGELEHFLTERYCLYTLHRGKVYRAYIHHPPWPLQDAEAEIDLNTMANASGIELPRVKPLLHFSRDLEVLVWWPELA